MTVPFILYWFAGLLRTRLDWKLNFKALRESSTVIYFCHAMFLELGEILLGSLYLTKRRGTVLLCLSADDDHDGDHPQVAAVSEIDRSLQKCSPNESFFL